MTKEQVFSLVQTKICEILPDVSPEQVTTELRMKELGANSIDRSEIVTESLADLGIRTPLVKFSGAETVGGLVELLYAYVNGKRT